LSDSDIAAVLTYIRTSFGNNASPVTPDQVAAVRSQIGNRTQVLTVQEALKLPE
jgi:mono/diheme cytochrome c family protein